VGSYDVITVKAEKPAPGVIKREDAAIQMVDCNRFG
jgi:ribosome-interacting GTPase 1